MSDAPPVRGEFAAVGRREITIVRGEGARLWDDRGRSFVDLGISLGVGSLGHSNPAIVHAIETQARQLIHVGSACDTPPRHDFVQRLLELLPPSLDRVFLSNSGAEGMETALKFARSSTARPGFVAALRGFHGRTFGALSATWRRDLREPFEPLVPGFSHVPYNDAAQLDRAVDQTTAAVILELVQGEGGVHVIDPEYLHAARAICDRSGALLIFDEIQTGMGRTGRRFAFERWGILPDILVLAKSLAGGIPIGATITTEDVERRFRGTHHSTFGGNALACAAGRAALDYLVSERLDERAERLGTEAMAQLRRSPSARVREVRGLGLLIGIELKERAAPYLQALRERGFLAIGAGPNVIRLLPPLVISEADWSAGLAAISEVLANG